VLQSLRRLALPNCGRVLLRLEAAMLCLVWDWATLVPPTWSDPIGAVADEDDGRGPSRMMPADAATTISGLPCAASTETSATLAVSFTPDTRPESDSALRGDRLTGMTGCRARSSTKCRSASCCVASRLACA